MLKRLNELNVVIGLFFLLLALILLVGAWASPSLSHPANVKAGCTFAVFGILMLLVRSGYADEA